MSLRRLASLWGPVLLQAALLFHLSSLRSVLLTSRGWDKVAHFVAYGILSGFLLRALHGGFGRLRATPTMLSIALATLYGATDEIHQIFVPGRDASWLDLTADALGAATAAAILGLWLSRPRRRGARPEMRDTRAVGPTT